MSVKIYTTKTCHWCKVTKEYFKNKKIEYEEYDVGEDEDKAIEMVNVSGQRSVPVIDIDGTIIVGFDKEAIDKNINK
jgi:glutaredoxin-like YruB-family protein